MSARLPNAVKEQRGTDQPCRMFDSVEHEKVSSTPPAPYWLVNAYALQEWDRLTPLLHKLGLLTHVSLTPLAVMCMAFGDIATAAAKGEPVMPSAIAAYRTLVADFGLTPVAATKVKPSKEGPKNKFAERGQLRAVT